MTKVTTKLVDFLNSFNVSFQAFDHEETHNSVESAKQRILVGAPRSMGAKALLIQTKVREKDCKISKFYLFVLCATFEDNGEIISRNVPSELIREKIGKNRFANKDELATVTGGLVPGSIPPFGAPIFPEICEVFVEQALFEHDKLSFNAASLTTSFVISSADYRRLLQSQVSFF